MAQTLSGRQKKWSASILVALHKIRVGRPNFVPKFVFRVNSSSFSVHPLTTVARSERLGLIVRAPHHGSRVNTPLEGSRFFCRRSSVRPKLFHQIRLFWNCAVVTSATDTYQGPIFRTAFFRGIFLGISCENFFPQKFPIFPIIFLYS
jgi:hypothetical protein